MDAARDEPLDQHLVVRAMAGDRVALDHLWRSHRRWVAAILLAHLPRSAELEDALQEVAMRMTSQIGTLHAPASFRPWLRTVSRNVAVSAGRRQSVRDRHSALPERDFVDPSHERAQRQIGVQDRLTRLLEIVHGMHVDYREPLLMRCVDNMSQAAIAAALDLPVTTVETRLARARRFLRREAGADQAPNTRAPLTES